MIAIGKEKRTEADLVGDFCEAVRSSRIPWGPHKIGVEFDYSRGRTDVILVDDKGLVFAFEAKLEKWRQALQQAYRNGCFAHKSYILVPEATARRAGRFVSEFNRRSVGLCTILEDGEIDIVIEATETIPLQPYLTKKALESAESVS